MNCFLSDYNVYIMSIYDIEMIDRIILITMSNEHYTQNDNQKMLDFFFYTYEI